MADLPPYPDTDEDTGDRGLAPSTARWLPVLGIAVAIGLLLLLVALHLTGTLGPGAH